jgi:hypothetical protein
LPPNNTRSMGPSKQTSSGITSGGILGYLGVPRGCPRGTSGHPRTPPTQFRNAPYNTTHYTMCTVIPCYPGVISQRPRGTSVYPRGTPGHGTLRYPQGNPRDTAGSPGVPWGTSGYPGTPHTTIRRPHAVLLLPCGESPHFFDEGLRRTHLASGRPSSEGSQINLAGPAVCGTS